MLRRLPTACLFFLLAGCAHQSPAPVALSSIPANTAPAVNLAGPAKPSPVQRISVPGERFTRADPDKPFKPTLIVTTQVANADLFFATMVGFGPPYRQATRLYRGQRAFILPFAENYAVASDGRTDLTFELNLLKADHSKDGPALSGVLWQDKVTSPHQLLFTSTTINYYAEPSDPLGECVLTARIHDQLGGDDITLTHAVVIEDYKPPVLPADFNAESWLQTYYLNPDPALALPALGALFDKLTANRRTSALPTILGFYDQLLNDNPWLLTAFFARLAFADPNEAYALSVVLGFRFRATTDAPAGCTPEIWRRLETFRTHAWIDPDSTLTDPTQLDCLWGRFFASGFYAPVYKLTEPLAAFADLGATDRYTADHPAAQGTDDSDPAGQAALPAEIGREQMLRASLWSLGNNAKIHPLVRAYLDLIIRTGKVAEGPRALLVRILQPDPETTSASPAAR
ncbi:hypothetical protein IMCC26134_13915 [Verrucomicrobia bacterium IMCC26134]|nr:hypothetical protein IMCC26134_13915 [Verrucomicrobia bacterium IMCC26134]